MGPDSAVLARLLQRHRPAPAVFDFAAIGDQQYGANGEAKWPALQAHINEAKVSFVVHTGDIKSGSTVCSDQMFANRLQAFNAFDMPMMLTPGDNEWTDCHRANNGSYNSIERLEFLRRTFYADNQSLGKQKMTLSQQSEDARYNRYVENSIWSMGNVLFATLHVIGSNNNLGRDAQNDAEFAERNAANFNWLKTIFSVARDGNFSGVVIVMQANPGWDGVPVRVSALEPGFRDSMFVLEDEAIVFRKPILVIMGDSHIFRMDNPMLSSKSGTVIENLMRLEVPGSDQVHWVRVKVDPASPQLFMFAKENVPANLVNHPQP